jgi:hypothetical protein
LGGRLMECRPTCGFNSGGTQSCKPSSFSAASTNTMARIRRIQATGQ